MAALQDWNIRFHSYNEPFLDTTGPFAGFLIPLFAWLARQDSIRKGKAVRLGMEKAKANGKQVGRPVVVDYIDRELVLRLRGQGTRDKLARDSGGASISEASAQEPKSEAQRRFYPAGL